VTDGGLPISAHDPDGRFRSLVDNLPVVVFTFSDEDPGKTLFVNDQIERILGYPVQDWLDDGDLWIRLIHPDDRDAVVEDWAATRVNRREWSGEFRYRHADGHWVWIHEHTRPVFDVDGGIVCWEGIVEDVSDRVRAEAEAAAVGRDLVESEARFRSLVENLPAVVYIETDGPSPKTLWVSPNVEDVLGHPPEAFLGPNDGWVRSIHPDDLSRVLDAAHTSAERSDIFDMEYRIIREDGGEVWVHDHCVLARDADGNPLQWQGVLVDITARVHVERELATTEARHRALIEGVPAVVYEMALDDYRRTLYASSHIEALLGYTRDEWLDQPDIWTELLHPDDREIELAAHDLHSSTGDPWAREYRLIAADGRVVWVRDHAVLVRDADGAPLTWQGVMVDITPQKEAEERLRLSNDELEFRVRARTAQLEEANELMSLEIGERRRVEKEHRDAEERFRYLVEDLPAVVYRTQLNPGDEAPDPSYASPQIEDLLGFAPAEWRDRVVRMSRVHPHDRDAVSAAWTRSSITGEPFQMEYRCFHKDGRIVSVLDRATMLSRNARGEPCVFQGVLIDLTARLDAERKAEEAEARFRELVELSPVVPYSYQVVRGDPVAIDILYVGPQMSEILGLPAAEWMDLDRWFDLVHPDDRDRVVEHSRANFELGEPWDLDYRMIAADGRVVWINDMGRCIQRDDDGRPARFQGAIADVTARRAVEEQLRAELGLLRDLIEGMPAIPWSHRVDAATGWTRYLYMGKRCFELLGYTAEELLAEPYHFPRLVHPDDVERVVLVSAEADRTGVWDDEYRLIHRDGSVRWIHGVGCRVTPPGVDPAVWHGITIDVTARHAPEMPTAGALADVFER
jgi:PAS domain S-box-containing protein